VPAGNTLLNTLASNKIFIPSACGGKGSCGWRLSCQTPVKQDMKIEVPPRSSGSRSGSAPSSPTPTSPPSSRSSPCACPKGEDVRFRAGGYVQLECPPHVVNYKDFDIQDEYRGDWDKFNLWRFVSKVDETTIRAYSMANYPDEKGMVKFNIRIASPPPGRDDIPPGIMSSWVFNLKPGDKVTVYGPFGEFFARDTDHEMVFVGGGAGMAPMRSHIFDQLKRLHSRARSASGTARARCARPSTSRSSTSSPPRTPTSSGTSRSPTRCPRTTGPATPASSTTCCTRTTSRTTRPPRTASSTCAARR
jgi:Na+-transporting NADH:ubiquinone oxidoreductase subunit F